MVGFATDTLRASGGGHGFAGGAVEQGAVRGRRPGKSQRGTIAVRELLANRVATSEAGKTTRRRGRGRRTAAGDAACAGHVTRKKTGAASVAGREAWVKAGAAAGPGRACKARGAPRGAGPRRARQDRLVRPQPGDGRRDRQRHRDRRRAAGTHRTLTSP